MHRAVTVLTLAAAVTCATAVAGRAEGKPEQHKVKRVVIHAPHGAATAMPDPSQIPGDHLKIEDLDTLVAGESRTYTSEGGQEVTITRREGEGERYTLAAGGEQIEIGAGHVMELVGGEGTAHKIVVRHEVMTKDGEQTVEEDTEVTGGPAIDFLVSTGGKPPLVIDIVRDRDGKKLRQVIVLKVEDEKATD